MLIKILIALAVIVVVLVVVVPEGERTAVTWSLVGRNNFIAKAMGLVMNMDKMIGGDFETGLAQMKSVVEAGPRQ